MSQDHIFIDVETSSLDVKTAEIIDIAVIRTDGEGSILASITDKIKPIKAVEEGAAKVNGYNERDWQNAVPFNVAIDSIHSSIIRGRTDKFVLVAHFAEFDRACIETSLSRTNIVQANPFAGRAWIDTAQLAWPLVYNGVIKSRSLAALAKFYGFENEAEHTASGDAEVMCKTYWAMMGRFKIAQGVERNVRKLGTGMLEGLVCMVSGFSMNVPSEDESEPSNDE